MKNLDKHDLSILKLKQVINTVKLSRSSIYLKVANSSFPKPIKLSERSSGWLEHEIQDWLRERVASSRGGQHE